MRAYHLYTPRLGFSHWQADDLPLATKLWGNPEVTRYISATGGFSGAEIAARLDLERKNQRLYGFQYYLVFLIESGDFAGCCGLRPYDMQAGILEFGVHLLPEFWGRGYATEAGHAVLAHATDSLGAAGLFAGHNPNNIASKAMLTGLGFRYVRDEFYPPTGLYHPSYFYERT